MINRLLILAKSWVKFQNLGSQEFMPGLSSVFVRIYIGLIAPTRPSFWRCACIVLIATVISSCREPIIHNLGESEANRLITRLNDVKIEAWKEKQPDGKWLVSTSSDSSMRALKHLDDVRILRQGTVEELAPPSLMASREERKRQTERLVAREIEQSILSIRGILEAHVHLNISTADSMFERNPRPSSSASVVLVVDSASNILRDDIARLVSGATGIESKDVSVVLTPGSSDIQTVKVAAPRSDDAILATKVPMVFGIGLLLAVLGAALLLTQLRFQRQRQVKSVRVGSN